jgi:hypothetical protein
MDILKLLFLRSMVVYLCSILDRGLGGTVHRQLISAQEVQDLLLDVRARLQDLDETLLNWEEESLGCIPVLGTDGGDGGEKAV